MNEEYVFLGRMQPKTRDYIKNLERENRMLEHNWNELKKYIERCKDLFRKEDKKSWINFKCVSDMMKELEEGGNNE